MKKQIFLAIVCAMLIATGCSDTNTLPDSNPTQSVVEKGPTEVTDILPNPDEVFANATGEKTVVNQDEYFAWRITDASEDMLETYIQALKDASFTKNVIEIGGYGYQAYTEDEQYVASVVFSDSSKDPTIQATSAEDYEGTSDSEEES